MFQLDLENLWSEQKLHAQNTGIIVESARGQTAPGRHAIRLDMGGEG